MGLFFFSISDLNLVFRIRSLFRALKEGSGDLADHLAGKDRSAQFTYYSLNPLV